MAQKNGMRQNIYKTRCVISFVYRIRNPKEMEKNGLVDMNVFVGMCVCVFQWPKLTAVDSWKWDECSRSFFRLFRCHLLCTKMLKHTIYTQAHICVGVWNESSLPITLTSKSKCIEHRPTRMRKPIEKHYMREIGIIPPLTLLNLSILYGISG